MHKAQAFCSNAFSVAVLDEIPDMVRVIDADGTILYSNNAIKLRFGNDQGERCNKIPGAASYCDDCIAQKCIRDGRRYSTIRRVKGRVYSVSAGPVFYNNETYSLEIFTDITHGQNLKEKLLANNSRMMNDLEIARSLQLSILRHNLPEIEGYSFYAEFLPCEALGGDMYDCFLARDGRIIMYIADVSGHGVMPAMLTVYLRQEMFAQCKVPNISPIQVLKNIQDSFEELNTEESIYITIFILALDPSSGAFVYANAGHSVPPLITKKGQVEELFLPGTPICRWASSHKREELSGMLEKKRGYFFIQTDLMEYILEMRQT
ncbi:MAG: SpoIIE family protein phosphatase [Christensenellales bacterium]|jgi:sigma-B regulation protein RsbU (phosphoserine phosphatase)